MIADARHAIDQAKAEAHDQARQPDGSVPSRLAAARFVALLGEIEGADPDAIGVYLDGLAITGAMKVLGDWRRRHRAPARTAKGTRLDVPTYAGAIRPDADGRGRHVQLPLGDMTADELRTHKARLAASRDTLSAEIRLVSDLIEVMEAQGYTSAAEALADLGRAS